jgi:heme/copper-type cytochrome/quinol oxidase subunit 3
LDAGMTKRGQLGMAMFLCSGAVFFFLLILACAYFHALPIFFDASGWVLTGLLLGGCLCVWREWRWAALALGAAFLVGLFGTKFSMLTAVHWLFVFAGVVAIAAVPASAIRTMALYWYFFTAVWVVIFVVASQA